MSLAERTVIDLFAGAGGLSLGAARAGFTLVGAVEKDPQAFATHKENFPTCKHSDADIAALSANDLCKFFELDRGTISGIVGGPPCQGFSAIGRRNTADSRNDLFGHFFRLVAELEPAFYLAENVPGILDPKYDAIREKAFDQLGDKYTRLPPITVKASEYGAPTIRTRVFFIGFNPTKLSAPLLKEEFLPPEDVETIRVRDALAGLPTEISSTYESIDETWKVIERLNSSQFMTKASGAIPNGVGNLDAIKKYTKGNLVSGFQGTSHLPDVVERFKALAQGKRDKVSKAVKLDPDGFCPTLRAGTGRDKGSYQAIRPVHFSEARVITPREAARLQGFPDWFIFHPTKWHSFRQIGNSVSPIVAEYLFSVIYRAL